MKVRLAALLLWSVFLFGYGVAGGLFETDAPRAKLFGRPPGNPADCNSNLYRTEGLRAMIAKETLAGHWLVPTLYDKPFVTKPPGMYVAIALCSAPFGHVTDWAARLPSFIFLTLTLVFLHLHLRPLIGEGQAFWIAMFLPVSFLWLEKCPSAEIDPLQLGWVAWSLLAFHRAYLAEVETRTRAALGWWFLSLTCVAGGLLTKWTAPAFFYLTVIAFVGIQGRWKMLFGWRHMSAAIFFAALVLLWAVLAANAVGWSKLNEQIGGEAAQRFAPGQTKKYPWGETVLFPVVVLAANTFSTAAVLLSLRKSFRDRLTPMERSVWLLGHCWIWPNLLFWTLPAQHNVRYVFPMIPGVCLLAGLWWVKWFETRPDVPWRRGLFITPIVVWFFVKIVYTEVIHPEELSKRDARGVGRRLAELVPPGEVLSISKLKDEGIMFYYDRPIEQIGWPADAPPPKFRWAFLMAKESPSQEPSEWQLVEGAPGVRLVEKLREQGGAPAFLVVDESP